MDKTELREFIGAKASFSWDMVSAASEQDSLDVAYWEGKHAAFCEIMDFLKEQLT